MGLFGRDDRRPPESSTTASLDGPATLSGPPKAAPDATTIAKSCSLEGSISASGDILIHGSSKGEVQGAASLVVAESGKIEAQLRARSITVAGSVEGDLFAQEKIELKPSARLLGNITAPKILIQEGATFEGQVFMKDPGKQPSPSKPGSAEAGAKDKDEKKKAPQPPQGTAEPKGSNGPKSGGGPTKS
jgi:cytoskeletal protein CcmA (bactofilin family)